MKYTVKEGSAARVIVAGAPGQGARMKSFRTTRDLEFREANVVLSPVDGDGKNRGTCATIAGILCRQGNYAFRLPGSATLLVVDKSLVAISE